MNRLLRVPAPFTVLVALILDAFLIYLAFIVATYVTLPGAEVYLFSDEGITRITVVALALLLSMHFQDMYSTVILNPWSSIFLRVVSAIGTGFIAEALITYADANMRLPFRVMILGSSLAGILLFLWRTVHSKYVVHLMGVETVLFVGPNSLLPQLADHISANQATGLRIVGYIGDEAPEALTMKNFGPYDKLAEVANAIRPHRIVVGMTDRRNRLPVKQLLDLRFAGFIIEEDSSIFESVCGRIPITSLRPSMLIFSGKLGPRAGNVMLHDIFNYLVALGIAILFSPVMLVTALAIKLTSPGPIFYRQKRVGLNGKVFDVLKFRTMIEPSNGQEAQTTGIGRLLRKTRLNELPQLFNVLRGDMALVGPRPERPEYVDVFLREIPFYGQRHCVRPGITGWAQINYGHADSIADTITKLEYDLYYIKYVALRLDMFIIFQTVKTVLLTRGES